jgi:DNA-binding Xre family transcriptional regulator
MYQVIGLRFVVSTSTIYRKMEPTHTVRRKLMKRGKGMIRLRVKEVAEKKGMSQSRLSRRADVDIKTIRKMYRQPEEANITLETLNKLAYALKVHPSELFEYEADAVLPVADDNVSS